MVRTSFPLHIFLLLVIFAHAHGRFGDSGDKNDEATNSEVHRAIERGFRKLEKEKEERQLYKKLGIDGRKRTPRDRLNRVNGRRAEAERRSELGEISEEVTKALVEATGRSVKDLEGDSSIRAAYGRELWRRILEIKADDEDDDTDDKDDDTLQRRKRQITDNDIGGEVVDEICQTDASLVDCSRKSKKFRTITGICNNLENPEWGAALTTEPRYDGMDPVFSDGVSTPRVSVSGGPLPSARAISNKVFQYKGGDEETEAESFNTLMSFNWGQFLDHDMVLTPLAGGGEGSGTTCCLEDTPLDRDECMPIEIPGDDPFYQTRCMDFVRSSPAPQENICQLGPRQVMNQLTSFIDGSTVYGSVSRDFRILRNYTNGRLDSLTTLAGQEMLPIDDSGHAICEVTSPDDHCDKAGDIRVDVQPGLGGTHLLMMREHNRIVGKLRELNPKWREGRLFQEARKIVGAIIQQITYREYLLNVLNEETREKYDLVLADSGYVNTYDPAINPGIRNAFAAAAYRFGHSMVPAKQAYLLRNWNGIRAETEMSELFLDPHLLVADDGKNVADLARFMIYVPAKKVDRFFEGAIRNKLFGGLDLTAVNIQRGRDHGLPPYIRWREHCGLSVPKDISDLVDHQPKIRKFLAEVYSDVADVDLYVGAMTEVRLPNSYVGPTFSCMIGEQFRALRKGDRFWYENSGTEGFTPEQLAEIRKVRLSKVMCNNLGIGQAQPNVFRQNSTSNPIQDCDKLEDMSFEPWG